MKALTGTTSVWHATAALPEFPPLQGQVRADVCVIGAGIAGLTTAYLLLRSGKSVTVIDAAGVGAGETGRTTAHFFPPDERYFELERSFGTEKATLVADAYRKATDCVESIIRTEQIACEFERLDGFLFSPDHQWDETLEHEYAVTTRLGLNVRRHERVPGLSFDTGPCLRFANQAQFHPLKYMAGLLRVMHELDVAVYENSHVKEFKHSGANHVIVTEDGSTVTAKHLVVATDSPVNNRFYIHTKQAAYRTYVVGFELDHKVDMPLLWDTEDPYHYIRVSGTTAIIGGEDHRTGQNPEHDPYDSLIKWARDNFNFLGAETFKWSGQVFEPVDGIAFIGKNPGMEKNVYIVTGQSGIGMTSSTIASQIISDLIDQKPNPMISVFDPSRSAIRDTTEFIKDNSNVAFQYKDWLTSSDVKNIDEIPADHGGLIRDGLLKSCVYHAEDGDFEKKCAVCPHLGGIVQWNDLEKTWDCPCHGSRFNAHGKVIEGPSISDLLER